MSRSLVGNTRGHGQPDCAFRTLVVDLLRSASVPAAAARSRLLAGLQSLSKNSFKNIFSKLLSGARGKEGPRRRRRPEARRGGLRAVRLCRLSGALRCMLSMAMWRSRALTLERPWKHGVRLLRALRVQRSHKLFPTRGGTCLVLGGSHHVDAERTKPQANHHLNVSSSASQPHRPIAALVSRTCVGDAARQQHTQLFAARTRT